MNRYIKGSFITVPTASIIGIGVGPQSLYMWLCSYANTTGSCFPSRSTLAEMMGCSERTVDAYLDELIAIGLVIKETRFIDNKQTSNNYFLPIRVAESARGVAEIAPTPSQNLRTELNPIGTQQTSAVRIVDISEEEKPKTKSKAKFPNARVAFSWFPRRQKSWDINTTELQHGEFLFERGEEKVRGILKFVEEHKDEEFFSKVVKPSDLERKWLDIVHYARKNNL